MKSRTSIKHRVTRWYTLFMILIICVLFLALALTGNRMMQSSIQDNLKSIVEYSTKDVKITDGKLTIDRDMISYKDGISIIVYKENNFIVTGTLPENVRSEIPFIDGTIRTAGEGADKFYVYDCLISDPDHPDVWVRGITSANIEDYDPVIPFMSKTFLIILPLLVLAASIGGYFITRRAFRPVVQITGTVKSIQAGGDLSKRIGLQQSGRTKDEIYNLAATFDDMLERLEASFEAEKQFSNDASHELRTPLAVIMAQCEYAMAENRSPEDTQESLEVIYGQSRKMSTLISRLLMIARADRGALTLNYEDTDVSQLTEVIAAEHEAAAKEKGIRISLDIQPDITAAVDESMFIRIWSNLISNSIKYSKDNGHIEISLTADGQYMTGSVKDDGIGIPKEDLPKIWNRFYQVDQSRNDAGSAGLGLAIVKWIITEHGGTVEAVSTLNKGTEIIFRLPLDHIEKEVQDYEKP